MKKGWIDLIIPFNTNRVKLTSAYGNRVLNGKNDFHHGYDLVGVGSTDVTAAVGGKVAVSRIITDKSNRTWEWGNYVCVHGDDGRYYYYCHLALRTVNKGDTVKVGDKLGVMGNTGYSFGAHLHFEVREKDGKTTVCPYEIIGIKNEVGTYIIPTKTQLEHDLDVLVKNGVINSPDYWKKISQGVKYMPELIHNMANALDKE